MVASRANPLLVYESLASDLRALVQLDGGKNSFGRLTCNALNLKPA